MKLSARIQTTAFCGALAATLAAATDGCTALEAAGLSDRLEYPGNATYEARIESYWSILAQLTPTCIFQPLSAAEVSSGVVALVAANSQFAVRSGGHTTWGGAANIEDGVTIDLGYMNSTTYHAENSTAAILPGARWGSVYSTLDALNISAGGGRAGDVGVGGLVLGGGNSFYAARKGLVCDNVANFEVVLANGSIVDANNSTNSDLWQALKGGSNNFGVVTRIDLYTFENGPLWGGIVIFPNSTTTQQISGFVNFTNNIVNEPYGSYIGIWGYTSTTNTTLVENVYDYTQGVAYPDAFKEFYAIPGNTSDDTRITNMTDLTLELESPTGYRDNFFTLTFQNDARVLQKAVDLHNDLTGSLQSATGNWSLNDMFQPFPQIFFQHGVENGGNVLGLDRFDENLVLFQCYLGWQGAEQDDLFNNAGLKLISDLNDYAVSINKSNPYIYLDYAYKTQDPLGSYGEENVEKIKAVAAKYDPTGVFQTLVPGGFKISKVNSTSS